MQKYLLTFWEHAWDKIHNDENSLRPRNLCFRAKLTYVKLVSSLSFKKNPSYCTFKINLGKDIKRGSNIFAQHITLL